jgi:polyisoprenoid-binding protein YceI
MRGCKVVALFVFREGFHAISWPMPFKFFVKSSVAVEGNFENWEATLTFTSSDASMGVLDVKIQATSVNTRSGMKEGKLKSKDFFDVKQDPLITFLSKRL